MIKLVYRCHLRHPVVSSRTLNSRQVTGQPLSLAVPWFPLLRLTSHARPALRAYSSLAAAVSHGAPAGQITQRRIYVKTASQLAACSSYARIAYESHLVLPWAWKNADGHEACIPCPDGPQMPLDIQYGTRTRGRVATMQTHGPA